MGPEHAPYIFKQMQPRFQEHWTERPDDALMRDHGLFILPHLPRQQSVNSKENSNATHPQTRHAVQHVERPH